MAIDRDASGRRGRLATRGERREEAWTAGRRRMERIVWLGYRGEQGRKRDRDYGRMH